MTAIIEGQVHTLYDSGARSVLLASYPDPAMLPAEDSASSSSKAQLTTYITGLTSGLERVATAWSPYMNIALADIGALFARIQSDPEAYGVNASYVQMPTACLMGSYPDTGPRELCNNASEYLFFDIYHPTSRIHEMMAGVFEETLRGFSR